MGRRKTAHCFLNRIANRSVAERGSEAEAEADQASNEHTDEGDFVDSNDSDESHPNQRAVETTPADVHEEAGDAAEPELKDE